MNSNELLNSLVLTAGDEHVEFGDTYFDWSCKSADGTRSFEVGDGDDAVNIDLTREQMAALHAALTRTLLQDA
jgi:hypothetical protein